MERTDLLISQAHQFQLGQLRVTFQGSLETKLPGTSETLQARYVSGAARASPKRSGIQFELFCVTLYASISFHSQCFGTHKWICKLHLKDVWGLFKLLCKLVSEFLWASTISFPNKKGAVKVLRGWPPYWLVSGITVSAHTRVKFSTGSLRFIYLPINTWVAYS